MGRKYRAELLNPETGKPYETKHHDRDPMGRHDNAFTHTDLKTVTHWVMHQRMHQPDWEYQIVTVDEFVQVKHSGEAVDSEGVDS